MENRRIHIISFTSQGNERALKLKEQIVNRLPEWDITVYSKKVPEQHNEPNVKVHTDSIYVSNLKEWTKNQFAEGNGIIFVGAMGIAVRTIASFVKDKLTDSPVLVMDEAGQFVIPLLSGHVGGANEIAGQIAEVIGAVPVITTATDVQGKLAIDVFSKKNNMAIGNREGIGKVSAKVLENKKLTLTVALEYQNQVDVAIASKVDSKRALLTLVPREYVIGIGCKKDKAPEELEAFVECYLRERKISWEQVWALASIDKKKDEVAMIALSKNRNVPFYTYDAKTLMQQEGSYTAFSFVEQQVGVDNVCERAARAGCEGNGQLIWTKHAHNGMTIAIAKKEWRLTLYEE